MIRQRQRGTTDGALVHIRRPPLTAAALVAPLHISPEPGSLILTWRCSEATAYALAEFFPHVPFTAGGQADRQFVPTQFIP